MALDTKSFERALSQLQEALQFSVSPIAKADPRLFQQFRNSAIQCFEFSFEIAIKMLRRQLERFESSEIVDQYTYRDLIRVAAERGLISDPVLWFSFREQRNITAHTYDEDKAIQVYSCLPTFLQQAQSLLIHLQHAHD